MTGGLRLTSRILLFDRDDRILLFLTTAPDTSGVARWLTPGGGVDPGENHAAAAIRELYEETGLVVDTVGAPVWAHDFHVKWDAADHSTGHAEFYRMVVDRFEPSNANWTDDEKIDVLEHRWWSLEDLLSTDELYEPSELPEIVSTYRPFHPTAQEMS
jgi:8-oxo-dGTP pyrophosphatase MutT (NUDIX family)